MTTENYYECGVWDFYSPGNVFKVTIYIQASKYIHCLQVPNSQHCRENGTGIGVSGIGVGQEKLGKNFLAFSSRQEDHYCVVWADEKQFEYKKQNPISTALL